MKKFLKNLSALTISLGFISVASATCPMPGQCISDLNNRTTSIKAVNAIDVLGSGKFDGEGHFNLDANGDSNSTVEQTIAGNGCLDGSCAGQGYSTKQNAWQELKADGAAKGGTGKLTGIQSIGDVSSGNILQIAKDGNTTYQKQIGANASGLGTVLGIVEGNHGDINTYQDSGQLVVTKMDSSGNPCGPNCLETQIEGKSASWTNQKLNAWVSGGDSGDAASIAAALKSEALTKIEH